MAKIEIKLLTPLHIGSGGQWTQGMDFIFSAQQKAIGIFSNKKIIEKIGLQNLEEWSKTIENNGSVISFLQRVTGNRNGIEQLANSWVPCAKEPKGEKSTIRKQLKTAINGATLPGSSLKGSMRTAIIGSSIYEGIKATPYSILDQISNNKIPRDTLAQEILGKDPNTDLFRFIRFSDAYFPKTEIKQSILLNQNQNGGLEIKQHGGSQLIEVCNKGQITQCTFELREQFMEKYAEIGHWNKNPLLKDKQIFFRQLKKHTLRLVNEELEFWENRYEDFPSGTEKFVDCLENIRDEITECTDGECVIRVGYGSGFNFMTGKWARKKLTPENYSQLLNLIRARKGYDYPKTRRILEDGTPLGFLKLKYL